MCVKVDTSAACAGERGAEIVDLLRQNPGVAVPVVLSRLDQKDEEWYAAS